MQSAITQILDIEKIREDFPILQQKIKGKNLIYLDNAATSQKPKQVIEALVNYYTTANANVHRGIHTLAERATMQMEATRETVKKFINAPLVEEIIFTKGTTEAINLIANTYGRQNIKAGDEIIISSLEHHSNMVPWQILCQEKGAILKVIPINEKGEIILEAYEQLLSSKTRIVAINHASNALGSINPIQKIIDLAHQRNAVVVIDGAQGAAHLPVDVQKLDCDFYTFSSHKMYGPTGIGVLYGKHHLLEQMPPYQTGGEMVKDVTFEETTFNVLPFKFEAGTPNIADIVAFKAALDYINLLGKENIAAYEHELLTYATEKLQTIPGLKIIGTAEQKIGIVSFTLEGIHYQDAAILLDNEGIEVRTGNHCAQTLMSCLGILGTIRASFAFYNTKEEIDVLVTSLQKVIKMLR